MLTIRKFAVVLYGCCLVCLMRTFARIKSSEIAGLSSDVYSRHPSSPKSSNAFKSRRVVSALGGVLAVFRAIAYPQISSSVVESISVYMVHHSFVFESKLHDQSVHSDRYMALFGGNPLIPTGVKLVRICSPSRVPLPLREPFVVGSINDGNLSLGQKDFTVRWFNGGHARSSEAGRFIRRLQRLTPLFYQGAA
jgi:hypothetical protein